MVKPAMAYLDIIRDVKCRCSGECITIAGEYAMIKAAAKWVG